MTTSREIGFLSFDGIGLEGTLVLPDSILGRAILIHGIQSERHEAGFYSGLADSLARIGIASFRFDYRCHGIDSKRSVKDLTLLGIENDIEAAYKTLLAACPGEKCIVFAASFGGGVSLSWAAKRASEISNIILFAPVTNYTRDYIVDQGLGTHAGLNDEGIKQLDASETVLTWRRPFSRAMINEMPLYSITSPKNVQVTIFHGDVDTGVEYEYSKRFAAENPGTSLITFHGAEHGFANPGDEELNDPQTLLNHSRVYEVVSMIIRDQAAPRNLP